VQSEPQTSKEPALGRAQGLAAAPLAAPHHPTPQQREVATSSVYWELDF